MIKYKINKIAERPKGVEVVLPPINPRLAIKSQYRAALIKMLRGLARSYRLRVLPALKNHRRMTTDAEPVVLSCGSTDYNDAFKQFNADSEEWFTAFESVGDELEREAATIASQILATEAARHTRVFAEAAKSSLSIDLHSVVREEDLFEYLRDVSSRNANLIKSLKNDTVKDIRRIVFEAKMDGRSFKKVSRELADRFDISVKRARLIAEDQTNKLNADLNRIRQEQAGVDSYLWQHSGDQRVRSRHRAINGRKYKWGESTDAEAGLPPGQPVRCRCTARAVIEF